MADMGGILDGLQYPDLLEAIEYLLGNPPQVQKLTDGGLEFQPVDLTGDTRGAMALEAAKRVRNNLFHGGKHTGHSPEGRDSRLVRSALTVLHHCLTEDPDLAAAYDA